MEERKPPAPAKGLASSSNPNRLMRRVQSLVIRNLVSARTRDRRRLRAEKKRQGAGEPHRVEYFHQVDDPYSHLAVQMLEPLAVAYDIELVAHLTASESGANVPEPELLGGWARCDAADVAPHYGLSFPQGTTAPEHKSVQLAERVLAAAEPGEFAERALRVGQALWSGERDAVERVAHGLPVADEDAARKRAEEGRSHRSKLGHYSGAMFHYAGEWYWGVDRLCHLEPRLAALGVLRDGAAPVAPRPAIDPGDTRAAEAITLELFPSLRSPYSAGSYDRTVELAAQTGVRLVLRPVLPMVMRGVPVTLNKGRYVFSDALREAALMGTPFGNFVDPIGKPVEDGFSLFPWARDQGKGVELISSFFRRAFAEAVDLSSKAGLRKVVEEAGLSWTDAERVLGNDDWRDELEQNRLVMYDEMGLWGVPSYRVRGPDGEPDWSAWGQDRLWRVAQEIRRRSQL